MARQRPSLLAMVIAFGVLAAGAAPAYATRLFTEAPGSPYATTGTDPYTVETGRFNGDDDPDVVVGRFSGPPKVFLGNGDGTFTPAPGTIPGSGSFTTAVGRINGDAIDDIVTADVNNAGGVQVFLGNGAGGFTQAPGSPLGGANPRGVALGDMNGDGKLDIVHTVTNATHVLLGNGSGGFASAPGSPFTGGGNRIALGLLNSDLILDVVYESGGPSTPVLLGNGSGGLAPAVGSPFATGTSYGGWPVAGDLDGDGRPEVVLAHGSSLDKVVSVMRTSPAGALSHVTGSPFRVPTPFQPRLVDLGGDGALDLALPAFDAGTMSVLVGDGAAAFRPMVGAPFATSPAPSHLAAADVNRDGRPDLLYLQSNTQNTLHVLLSRAAMTADRTAADLGTVAVGAAVTQTVLTLTNTAPQAVRPGTASITGPQAGEFAIAGDTCAGTQVPTGGTCTVSVRFAPGAAGSRGAELAVPENGDVFRVALSGSGASAPPPTATGTPVPAGSPSPPDTTGPRITLRGLSSRITRAGFRRKGLRLTVETDEAASVRGVLAARVVRRKKAIVFQAALGDLEIGSRSLPQGSGRRSLVLKPSKRFVTAVRNRRLRLVVRVTATDAAGNARTSSRSVLVR